LNYIDLFLILLDEICHFVFVVTIMNSHFYTGPLSERIFAALGQRVVFIGFI